MAEARPTAAPWWTRSVASVVRRLPVGRYRAAHAVARHLPQRFIARAPDDLGGWAFECDTRDAIMRDVYFAGRYAPQETALIARLLGSGMTFVDIGANWGYFTLLAAHAVGPRGHVLGIEPHPGLAALLSRNVARNGFRHATVLPLAVAERPTTMLLTLHDEAAGNFGLSRLAVAPKASEATVTVSCDTLDSVLDEQGLDIVDLMKIDIEGGEGAALDGLRSSLTRGRVKRLLIELHPALLAEWGRSTASVRGALEKACYRGWSIDHSPAAVRHAAYQGRRWLPRLTPLSAASVDPWPHDLWLAPGVSLPRAAAQ